MKNVRLALAKDSRERSIQRLKRRRSVSGGALPKKKVPDGRPLGGDLPGALKAGRVFLDSKGFSVIYSRVVEEFDRGGRGKPARPIVGIDRAQREEYQRRMKASLIEEARRLGISK